MLSGAVRWFSFEVVCVGTWPCHVVSAESDESREYDGGLSCAALCSSALLTFSSSLILLFPQAKLCRLLLRTSEPGTPQGYAAET